MKRKRAKTIKPSDEDEDEDETVGGGGVEKNSEKSQARTRRSTGRKIEQYRKDNDLMWELFDGKEREKLIRYLEGVIVNVKEHYGENLEKLPARVAYSKSDDSDLELLPVPPPGEILDILNWLCYNPKINMQHVMLFFSISLRPGVYQYFMSDEVKLTNKARFELWVQKMLVPECDSISSGWISMTRVTPENFVRSLRTSYVKWNSLPMPPPSGSSDV